MLDPRKILAALYAKRDQFAQAEVAARHDLEALTEVLHRYATLNLIEIEQRLGRIARPGARPTPEHDEQGGIIVPFDKSWANHQQARAWALEVLRGVPTIAADGSQIPPSKDISIPIGLVQAAWFENRHLPEGSYVKDVQVEVLASDDLTDDESSEDGFPGWQVNWHRFRLEVDCLIRYMEAHANSQPKPLCFFDGSLILSFVGQMLPSRQSLYFDSTLKLLETSQRTAIPLVGYVDTSYANDLVSMLSHLFPLQLSGKISDAAMLRPRMRWGDRSQVYICARKDEVEQPYYYEKICFAYLKTTQDGLPARVEFPRWIYEQGEHERLLNLVRADCVVGTGYPYTLETADATAVLTMQDRQRFYRLLQDFAEKEGLPLRFSKKTISKLGRRI